jgi:hypothetical protein
MALATWFSPKLDWIATVTKSESPLRGVTWKTISPSERADSLTSIRHLLE